MVDVVWAYVNTTFYIHDYLSSHNDHLGGHSDYLNGAYLVILMSFRSDDYLCDYPSLGSQCREMT